MKRVDILGYLTMRNVTVILVLVAVVFGSAPAWAKPVTIYADADATISSGGGSVTNSWQGNHGGATTVHLTSRYSDSGAAKFYLHFDLNELGNRSRALSARLKLDHHSNDDDARKSVYIFAIMDEAKDWELLAGTNVGEMIEGSATGADTPGVDDLTWKTAPLNEVDEGCRFLEEGTTTNAVARQLAVIPAQDLPGSVDIDVIDLVNWILGKNPSFAAPQFDQSDKKITIMVRQASGSQYFPTDNWYSKESADYSTTFPARLEMDILFPMGTVVTIK